MTVTRLERAVLLADITGSTPLYESIGDRQAAERIFRCIDWMRAIIERNGGVFVVAKGDDVLATFESADAALSAVEAILAEMPRDGLSVHAGLHFGSMVADRGDIFGDAVNVTARLAGSANPGEVLMSRDFAARLTPERARALRPLNAMTLKGKTLPVEVFSLNDETQLLSTLRNAQAPRVATSERLVVQLTFEAGKKAVGEGGRLSIGRGPDNEIVVSRPWVSRRHAAVTVTGNRVQLTDRSSYGTYVTMGGSAELTVRREMIILVGSGRLSPGTSITNPDAAIIEFTVDLNRFGECNEATDGQKEP